MTAFSKNLGLIKAISAGTTPPQNTQMIWYNTNTGINAHYAYDTVNLQWKPLADFGGSTGLQEVYKIALTQTASTNDFTATADNVDFAYVEEQVYLFDFPTPLVNNGAADVRINVSTLGLKNLKQPDLTTDIKITDLLPNKRYLFTYRGGVFVPFAIVNQFINTGTGAAILVSNTGTIIGPAANLNFKNTNTISITAVQNATPGQIDVSADVSLVVVTTVADTLTAIGAAQLTVGAWYYITDATFQGAPQEIMVRAILNNELDESGLLFLDSGNPYEIKYDINLEDGTLSNGFYYVYDRKYNITIQKNKVFSNAAINNFDWGNTSRVNINLFNTSIVLGNTPSGITFKNVTAVNSSINLENDSFMNGCSIRYSTVHLQNSSSMSLTDIEANAAILLDGTTLNDRCKLGGGAINIYSSTYSGINIYGNFNKKGNILSETTKNNNKNCINGQSTFEAVIDMAPAAWSSVTAYNPYIFVQKDSKLWVATAPSTNLDPSTNNGAGRQWEKVYDYVTGELFIKSYTFGWAGIISFYKTNDIVGNTYEINNIIVSESVPYTSYIFRLIRGSSYDGAGNNKLIINFHPGGQLFVDLDPVDLDGINRNGFDEIKFDTALNNDDQYTFFKVNKVDY